MENYATLNDKRRRLVHTKQILATISLVLILVCFISSSSVTSGISVYTTINSKILDSSLSLTNSNNSNFTFQNSPVMIDRALFLSTVPSYAVIGHNYTVKVLINNNSDQPIPVILRLIVPVNVMVVHPLIFDSEISPKGQSLANFSLVAFSSSNQEPLIVSAQLSIWFLNNMSRPQMVDDLSTTVYGVNHSPDSQYVFIFVGLLAVASIILLILYRMKLKQQTESRVMDPYAVTSQSNLWSSSRLTRLQQQRGSKIFK